MKRIMWKTVSGELPRTIHQVKEGELAVGGHVVSLCGTAEEAGEIWEHGEEQNVRQRIVAALGEDTVECRACALESDVSIAEPRTKGVVVSEQWETHQCFTDSRAPQPWDDPVSKIVRDGTGIPGCAVTDCPDLAMVAKRLTRLAGEKHETHPVCYDHKQELDAGRRVKIRHMGYVKYRGKEDTAKAESCNGVCEPHPGRTLRCAVCQAVAPHSITVTKGGATEADREWVSLCCRHYRSMAHGDAEVIGGVTYIAWGCLQPPPHEVRFGRPEKKASALCDVDHCKRAGTQSLALTVWTEQEVKQLCHRHYTIVNQDCAGMGGGMVDGVVSIDGKPYMLWTPDRVRERMHDVPGARG